MAPIVAGEYGGRCRYTGSYDFVQSGFKIAADGKVTTGKRGPTMATDLREADTLALHRSAGNARAVYLSAKIGTSVVNVSSTPSLLINPASLAEEERSISCERPSSLAGLGSARPDKLVAALIAAPGPTIVCSPHGATPTPVAYSYKMGVLTLDEEVFDLNKLDQEQIFFEKGFKKLFYTAHMDDGRKAMLDFDEHGLLAKIEFTVADGQAYSCTLR